MTTTRPRLFVPAPLIEEVPDPIRVLYLIDSLGQGGAEGLLVTYLRHLGSHGVEPVVATFHERDGNPLAEPIRALGVPTINLGIRRLRQRGAYRRVTELLAELGPDLVHTHLEFSNILGVRAAHGLGIPVISTLHTLDRPPPRSREGLRYRLMAWALRRFADRVIAVSESARRHHMTLGRLRPEQVITVHNGIELDRYVGPPGSRRAIRLELGIPHDAPLVLTVAVLRRAKGVQHMLGALPSILVSLPDTRYLVVGDGDHRTALEEMAAHLGIDHRVVFAGRRSDIGRVLAAADLFVLPSLTEALPTVLAEAMAASLPTVASNVGGIPEMVLPGRSTTLVEPADEPALSAAVRHLLANPIQAASMGRIGRRFAEARFDLRRQAAELVEEYRFLIGGGIR